MPIGGLVPRLRFPEFREAGEWEEKKLSSMAQLISGLHLSPDQYGKEGEVPYFTGPSDFTNNIQKISKWTKESTNTATENDTLITVKGSGVGEIWYLSLPAVAIGRQLMAVRILNGSTRFIFHFLLTKRIRFEDLASGNLIPGLSRGDILDLEARFPSPPEQQKIADCLASLDELITLEAQKLDTLKTHKKGLMQQLFPAEGETLPKLRFPEFRDAGEWGVWNLGRVAENLDNQRVPITSGERVAGGIPYYGASGIVDYVEGFIFDEDLLCVSEDGANLVARTYPIAFPISGKTWVNNHAHVLRFENACTQKFVEVYLNSIKLDDFITGMAQPKLNKAMLDSIPIPQPTVPEQQRIADCLASLDDLITAQTQKLAALKTHKKGLMQQLFPALDEVPA
jgi:type I restriction enzyme S subunit